MFISTLTPCSFMGTTEYSYLHFYSSEMLRKPETITRGPRHGGKKTCIYSAPFLILSTFQGYTLTHLWFMCPFCALLLTVDNKLKKLHLQLLLWLLLIVMYILFTGTTNNELHTATHPSFHVLHIYICIYYAHVSNPYKNQLHLCCSMYANVHLYSWYCTWHANC